MTRIPYEERHEIKVGEGEPYDLHNECSATGCRMSATEGHHLVRRSETATGESVWWINYKGQRIGNLVGLCQAHHLQVTENRVRIQWNAHNNLFLWVTEMGYWPLQHQPPIEMPPTQVISNADPGDETTYDYVVDPEDRLDNADKHFEGPAGKRKCVTCHRVLPTPESEKEPKRERRTWTVTVPKDERENGAEVLDTLLGQCAELFSHDEGKNLRYFTLTQALALVVQHGSKMVSDS